MENLKDFSSFHSLHLSGLIEAPFLSGDSQALEMALMK